jgi:hypothetical protein
MEIKRNTNWLLLSADSKNCWNSLDYDNDCVWQNNATYDIWQNSYKIYMETNWRWKLEKSIGLSSKDYLDQNYRDFFRIKKDTNWLYTHNTWNDFLPVFTREIKVSYPWADSDSEKMTVNSIVMWQDNQWNKPHMIDLEVILTNWKK